MREAIVSDCLERHCQSRPTCLMQILPIARKTGPTQKRTATAVALLVSMLVGIGCSDTNPDKALASAKDYLQKNDIKSATIQVKNALQINPDLAEARFVLGS